MTQQPIGFRQSLLILSLLTVVFLVGCGNKGDLYRPDSSDITATAPAVTPAVSPALPEY